MKHGVYGYRCGGCRCKVCTAANSKSCAEERKKRVDRLKAGLVEVEHGKHSTYVNYGCRCSECMAAARRVWASNYKSKQSKSVG